MRIYTFSLLFLFLFNMSAQAQSACEQLVSDRAQMIPKVIVSPDIQRIEIKLQSGLWTGNYGLQIYIEGQLYTSIGDYAEAHISFPIYFSGLSKSNALVRTQSVMQAFLHSAAIMKTPVSIDPSRLNGIVDGWEKCNVEGDSIAEVLALVTSPTPTPTPKPDPQQPTPLPEKPTPHDQTPALPEGQQPSGKTFKVDGDR